MSHRQAQTSAPAYVVDGLIATPERTASARELWLEAQADDFEQTRRHRWRDRATGCEYRKVHGLPLLSPSTAPVEVWFVEHDQLIFLTRVEQLT